MIKRLESLSTRFVLRYRGGCPRDVMVKAMDCVIVVKRVCGGARGFCGGARGVMVIVIGNEHGDTSSNPGRD